MMDNEYKLKTDDKFKKAQQLVVDETSGTTVWHIIKEYPYLGRRDYVIASKLWQPQDGDEEFFCVSKVFVVEILRNILASPLQSTIWIQNIISNAWMIWCQ